MSFQKRDQKDYIRCKLNFVAEYQSQFLPTVEQLDNVTFGAPSQCGTLGSRYDGKALWWTREPKQHAAEAIKAVDFTLVTVLSRERMIPLSEICKVQYMVSGNEVY